MMRRPGRPVCVLAVVLALVGLPAAPAPAHLGGSLAEPVFEHMAPAVPGVDVEVAHSVTYQFVVTNRSPQPVQFLADSGEPFLEIGPDGVRGNFASPTFYDSNAPEGLGQFPEKAKAGADVPPIWRRIAAQTSWGWYDHRLHPAENAVPPEIVKAGKLAVLGRWKVPFRVGDQTGELLGRFEFRPPTGSYGMVQKSTQTPADGVKVQVVSASTVPAFFVENLSPEPVLVLGRDGEPFARIGPKVSEVNVRSPAWAEMNMALGGEPTDETDATAEPKWRQIADTPRWRWLEFRAAAPKSDPPEAIVERNSATTVKKWSVPILIGDRRHAVEGITEFVPIAVLRGQAGAPAQSDGGSDTGRNVAIGFAVAVLATGSWLVTSLLRSRSAKKAR
jgi:hypothetical protein